MARRRADDMIWANWRKGGDEGGDVRTLFFIWKLARKTVLWDFSGDFQKVAQKYTSPQLVHFFSKLCRFTPRKWSVGQLWAVLTGESSGFPQWTNCTLFESKRLKSTMNSWQSILFSGEPRIEERSGGRTLQSRGHQWALLFRFQEERVTLERVPLLFRKDFPGFASFSWRVCEKESNEKAKIIFRPRQ